jgi:DNA-directed RNA polymerase subunit RPC12/RpoP
MGLEVRCPHCGRTNWETDDVSGQLKPCFFCKKEIIMIEGAAGPETKVDQRESVVADELKIRFQCANCGKAVSVPSQHAGKKAKCPGCRSVPAGWPAAG